MARATKRNFAARCRLKLYSGITNKSTKQFSNCRGAWTVEFKRAMSSEIFSIILQRVKKACSAYGVSNKEEKHADMYGLLTKCEAKMAGYWPSSLLRVYGPRQSRGP